MGQTNKILSLCVVILFVISTILIAMEQPTWFYSIPLFALGIIIIITKIFWNVAGWADKQTRKYFDWLVSMLPRLSMLLYFRKQWTIIE